MSDTNGGTALKPFSSGGRFSGSAGSAGISITLRTRPFAVLTAVLAIPHPDGGRKVFQRDNHADESEGLVGVVGRPKLEHHLLLRTQINFLQMAAPIQVPDVQLVAVLSAQQQLRDSGRSSPYSACPIQR